MVRGVTILGLLTLLLSCNSKEDTSQHELGLVYNVLRDVDIDNFEVYSMNLDGSDKKKHHRPVPSGLDLLFVQGHFVFCF